MIIYKKLSIIIPTLNEATIIESSLQALCPLQQQGHEVIVVDGKSEDNTCAIAENFADKVITSKPGRSFQMNAGVNHASGDILVFLHADTRLPDNADTLIINGLASHKFFWGRFDIRLTGENILYRCIETLMNWRSKFTGIATGDQVIFIDKLSFKRVGGYPQLDLMEDIALCKKLQRISPPLCLTDQALTSTRRWEKNGILKTILLMWWLRLGYFFGRNPKHLMQDYQQN